MSKEYPTILQVNIYYENSKINKIAVLADFSTVIEDIRCIVSTTAIMSGYTHIKTNNLSNELIKDIVNYGFEANIYKHFPLYKKSK